jgi:hypothetical protein
MSDGIKVTIVIVLIILLICALLIGLELLAYYLQLRILKAVLS